MAIEGYWWSVCVPTFHQHLCVCVSFLDPFGSRGQLELELIMKRPAPTRSDSEIADMEDEVAAMAKLIDIEVCRKFGVQDSFLKEWAGGVILEGAEQATPFFSDDYPKLKENAEVAASELDRPASRQMILWYPDGTVSANLSVCPGNLILKGSRPREVQDWTKAGLNNLLTIPDVNYGTMDSFLELMHP